MNIWLIQAPPDRRMVRPQYLRSIDERGVVTLTEHGILARRFHGAAIAREWASQHAVLDEFLVVRAP
jgi:hypothetical protein